MRYMRYNARERLVVYHVKDEIIMDNERFFLAWYTVATDLLEF